MSAVKNAIRTCPDCDGDGFQIEQVGPGHEYGFGFVPTERLVQCETCAGTAQVLDAPRAKHDGPEEDLPF